MEGDNDANRNLRRLIKKHGIFFRLSIDGSNVSPSHKDVFDDIVGLGNYQFSTYLGQIDVRTREEPWRRQTKARVEWLSKKAADLVEQRRNEAGWRLNLENHVLLRFGVEVACPTCRARIWRSEIESSIQSNVDFAEDLKMRRQKRKACSCPPNKRPLDIYDLGTNPLFDDRAEEIVYDDRSLESTLAETKRASDRKPDRVFGLRETKNLESLLDSTVAASSSTTRLRNSLRATPFKDTAHPLLFPFLILESKSEKSSNSFEDIQCQTAFPIKMLLKLQLELRTAMTNPAGLAPLVWFLAHRGDAWRVYAAYVTETNRQSYEILLLWNGSLLSRDHALQLILILDYIFDWARDVYRPSILRQLSSIVSGKTYDEVSLLHDSDVESLRRNVFDWMRAVRSITAGPGSIGDHDWPIDLPQEDQSNPWVPSKSQPGLVVSANTVTKKLTGLCLWEGNIQDFFRIASGRTRGPIGDIKAQSIAREILNCFGSENRHGSEDWRYKAKYNAADVSYGIHLASSTFKLNGSDLQIIEQSWIGNTATDSAVSPLPPEEKFYCLISSECFFTASWEVVQQITYLAISVGAAHILVDYACRRHLPPSIPMFPGSGLWTKNCTDTAIQQCIGCLSSASSSQSLAAAIAARSLVWLPTSPPLDLTTEDWNDSEMPDGTSGECSDTVWFTHDYSWGQGVIVDKYLKHIQRVKLDKIRVEALPKEFCIKAEERRQAVPQGDFSFARLYENATSITSTQVHSRHSCERCNSMDRAQLNQPWLDMHASPVNEMTLVAALDMQETGSKELEDDERRKSRYDFCLFVHSNHVLITTSLIRDTLKAMVKGGSIYHSLKAPRRGYYNRLVEDALEVPIMWNLPKCYLPASEKVQFDLQSWIAELTGTSTPTSPRPEQREELKIPLRGMGESAAAASGSPTKSKPGKADRGEQLRAIKEELELLRQKMNAAKILPAKKSQHSGKNTTKRHRIK